VACATRYGSRLEVAEEVAEEVARVLPQSGLLVDDLSVREVKSLNGYRAVVVGVPLYIGKFLRDARRCRLRLAEKAPAAGVSR